MPFSDNVYSYQQLPISSTSSFGTITTSFHLRLPYITAIDGFPMDTLYWKKKLITKAIKDHALCIFNHDTQVKAAYLSGETGNPKIESVDI